MCLYPEALQYKRHFRPQRWPLEPLLWPRLTSQDHLCSLYTTEVWSVTILLLLQRPSAVWAATTAALPTTPATSARATATGTSSAEVTSFVAETTAWERCLKLETTAAKKSLTRKFCLNNSCAFFALVWKCTEGDELVRPIQGPFNSWSMHVKSNTLNALATERDS